VAATVAVVAKDILAVQMAVVVVVGDLQHYQLVVQLQLLTTETYSVAEVVAVAAALPELMIATTVATDRILVQTMSTADVQAAVVVAVVAELLVQAVAAQHSDRLTQRQVLLVAEAM
jgi:hypothetical protein